MIKKIIVFAFLACLGSCKMIQEKGIAFKIVNSSAATITDVAFSTSENLETVTFDGLGQGQDGEGFLVMKDNKVDGNYTLEFTDKDGKIIKKSFGYYSNGATLEEWVRIEIKNDTTLVTFGEFPDL